MSLQPAPSRSLPPECIGDYRIISALSATAFRALGPGDRAVILKLFPADCMQRGQLHPNIHARLSRVRELAHPGVANLHSVERDGNYVFAVWDDVEGLAIDRYMQTNRTSPAALARLAKELILVVESLHTLGIVHGRISATNVIVDSRANLRLTHISPLLYDDPELDNAATIELISRLMQVGEQAESPLGRAVQEAIERKLPLRMLAARLSVSVDTGREVQEQRAADSEKGLRVGALAAALLLVLAGTAVAYFIYRWSTTL